MKTGKFNLENSPYIFNVFRNGCIWLKGFNDLKRALRYCEKYADTHNNPIDLWQTLTTSNDSYIVKMWNQD